MRVLHITPDFNFAVNFVKPVCLEQIKMNMQVTVISTTAFYSIKQDQKVFFSMFENDIPKLKLKLLNLRLRKFETSLLKSYVEYIKMLRQDSYDVIILHTTIDTLLPLILARLFSNAKNIYFNHGVPSLGYTGIRKWILNGIEKINTSIATQVFTIGPSMSNALTHINKHSNPVFVSPGSACGINLIADNYDEILKMRKAARIKLNIAVGKKVVIFVGRPVKRKGIFELIEAWGELGHSENYTLLLAGPTINDLKDITYTNNIMPLGYITNMVDYYLVSDMLCVPSYHEGLGYTYLEAAAAGCVPICSDIPGPTDFVINDVTGLTVRPGNVEDIRKSLNLLIGEDLKRFTLAKNAFESVLNFNQEIIAPAIAKALVQ